MPSMSNTCRIIKNELYACGPKKLVNKEVMWVYDIVGCNIWIYWNDFESFITNRKLDCLWVIHAVYIKYILADLALFITPLRGLNSGADKL